MDGRQHGSAPAHRSVAGIVCRNGSFLLGKRINQGAMGGRWEFLGGKAEPGETLHDALIREFLEETGCRITVGDFLCSVQFSNASGPVELSAFAVTLPDSFSADRLSLPEHTDLAWFRFSEIPSLYLVDSDRKLLPGLAAWFAAGE